MTAARPIRWVAVALISLVPLLLLRSLERAVNRELLRRELHRIGAHRT